MSATTIVIANSKGGVGKSATAAILCCEAARRHLRALAVDLDPQGSLTRYLYAGHSTGDTFAAAMESDDVWGEEVAVATRLPGVDLLPAGPQLDARIELQQLPHVEVRLRTLFDDLGYAQRYDLVVVDTRPSLGRLTLNAFGLPGARVVIPVRDDDNALDALRSTLAALQQVRRLSNPDVRCVAVVPTMVNSRRTRLQRMADEWLGREYPDLLVPPVPESEAIRQAIVARKPIPTFVAGTRVDSALSSLFEILLNRAQGGVLVA